jgi:hypothetical protein
MYTSWGSNPICFRTLVVFIWYLIPMTCLLGRQTFFVLVLCAIMKSVEVLVYSLMIFFINWSLVFIGIFSKCYLQSCVDLGIWYNLDNLFSCHTCVCVLLVYLVFCLNYISPGSRKSCACIFIICISYGMLTFVNPIYRINSIKS